MLAVLAEIDCLDYLQKQGIYPDEYYTDYDLFRNHCTSFKDATILFILAGSCHFNKRHITEFIKSQYKRMENEKDIGISNVIVVTDYMIPTLQLYYKFDNNLDNVYKCNGWKKAKFASNIWVDVDKAQTQTRHEVALYLSDFDKGITEKKIEKYKSYESKEDELIRLIIQPNIKQLILDAKASGAAK